MLGVGRYLLGVAEIGVLAGFAWLGASRVRSRPLPEPDGPPAYLTSAVLALALLLWTAELLGSFGLFEAVPYVLAIALVGLTLRLAVTRGEEIAHPRAERYGLWPLVGLAVAAVALVHFATGVRLRLSTGMTGFDSTWYHGPFAAGFFQRRDTWSLHFI